MFKAVLVTLGIVVLSASSLSAEPTSLFGVDFFWDSKNVKKMLARRFYEQSDECGTGITRTFMCTKRKKAIVMYVPDEKFLFSCKVYNGCYKLDAVKSRLQKRWDIKFEDCDMGYCYSNREIDVYLYEDGITIELKYPEGINFD